MARVTILRTNSRNPSRDTIHAAARIIKKGGVVALPTETVYGLAANPFSIRATRKIFKIKGRSEKKPLLILIGNRNDVYRIAKNISGAAEKLMDAEKQLLSPMTERGLDLLLNTIVTSTAVALAKATVLVPVGYGLDEIELTNNMTRDFGVAALTVNETNNNLTLRFDGIGALIQDLSLPLDVDKAISEMVNGDKELIHINLGKKPIISGRGLIEEPPLVNPSLSFRQ